MSDDSLITSDAGTLIPNRQGTLYVVATPIGNLGDMSARAVDVLRTVDVIYAEDTRHSARLLQHCDISNTVKSLHEHNERARVDEIVANLSRGLTAAVISDAGTPLISDPGYRLVARCVELGLTVSPVPGASALIAALSVSGLPTDKFLFLGFTPARASARKQWLERAGQHDVTVVMYESRHRIKECLLAMHDCLGGEREVVVARELTKAFETVKKASLSTLCEWIEDPNQQKGEFVIMIEGVKSKPNSIEKELNRVLGILLPEMSVKRAAVCAQALIGCKRKVAYEAALVLRSEE